MTPATGGHGVSRAVRRPLIVVPSGRKIGHWGRAVEDYSSLLGKRSPRQG